MARPAAKAMDASWSLAMRLSRCVTAAIFPAFDSTAATLVVVRDVSRFKTADSLKAYLGVYPRRQQSGSTRMTHQ